MLARASIARPRHRNAPRLAAKSARAFLQWIRGRECTFAYLGDCEGRMETMHLDFAGKIEGVDPALGKGASSKVADRYSVPACEYHHRTQHAKGWITFLAMVNATKEGLIEAANRLWFAWPGRRAWEAKQESVQ